MTGQVVAWETIPNHVVDALHEAYRMALSPVTRIPQRRVDKVDEHAVAMDVIVPPRRAGPGVEQDQTIHAKLRGLTMGNVLMNDLMTGEESGYGLVNHPSAVSLELEAEVNLNDGAGVAWAVTRGLQELGGSTRKPVLILAPGCNPDVLDSLVRNLDTEGRAAGVVAEHCRHVDTSLVGPAQLVLVRLDEDIVRFATCPALGDLELLDLNPLYETTGHELLVGATVRLEVGDPRGIMRIPVVAR